MLFITSCKLSTFVIFQSSFVSNYYQYNNDELIYAYECHFETEEKSCTRI